MTTSVNIFSQLRPDAVMKRSRAPQGTPRKTQTLRVGFRHETPGVYTWFPITNFQKANVKFQNETLLNQLPLIKGNFKE